MGTSFLSIRNNSALNAEIDGASPAVHELKPKPAKRDHESWDFAFATGIECSNPLVAAPDGGHLRRDLLEECGHYRHWREDLQLVADLGTPFLRYGLPNHLIHIGPDRYDWSFADEVMNEIHRLGLRPILDLLHFGIPEWMGDFQNPEMPFHFARYAGAVAQRYPWVRGYTPVNEIFVAARNSGWDGLWNERLRSERGFVTALKHLVAANLLAEHQIMKINPGVAFVQSESAEYVHHIVIDPAPNLKLKNELVFVSLDLLYSKTPNADVLMFLLDNGMTRDEFKWFMNSQAPGFQVMGNDYYGHNEKLLLPDGSMTYGEDVLGWYLITLRYYHRYYKPVMHTETNTPHPERSEKWLWKEWTNVLRMRQDGVPVVGFTWYSLVDQMDWDTQLSEKHGRVNECGLYDMDRRPRPVAKAYRGLIDEFRHITALPHGKIYEVTQGWSSA